MACENDMKFKFQHPYIESCWNTAILIHVRIVYSCFHVMTGAKYVVETGTIWPTKPAMFPSWSFADKVGWSLHEKAEAVELNSLDYWSIPPQYLPPQEKNPQNWVSKGKKKKKKSQIFSWSPHLQNHPGHNLILWGPRATWIQERHHVLVSFCTESLSKWGAGSRKQRGWPAPS